MKRREFLGAAIAAAMSSGAGFRAFAGSGTPWTYDGGYGPLRPVNDETTGLPLLELPEGFRYRSFGWTGDAMTSSALTPSHHDGMAVVAQRGSSIILVRNHEVASDKGSFADDARSYDRLAGGGTTNIEFDTEKGEVVRSWASLSGTVANCCGGPTPNESWLTCEELIVEDGKVSSGSAAGYRTSLTKRHGYVFEVPAFDSPTAQPIKDMGCFAHEAVAVDPESGAVYLTEDRLVEAGFYRFLPNDVQDYLKGGRLQMMQVRGRPDMRSRVPTGQDFDVEWVDIEEPDRPNTPGNVDGAGVYAQGRLGGASTFTRLEGCWYGNGKVFFTSTNGGDAQTGQLFCFDVNEQTIRQIYQSPGADVLDYPDNITLSPNGCVMICEDGGRIGHMLMGLDPTGKLFPFVRNNVILRGERNEFEGDFRAAEWCGACFSPDGKWMFANIQLPGITVAITGPWERGVV